MKLKQNTKYTTIALYTISVFAACLIIYRVIFAWDDTAALVSNIISIMTPFITALLVAYFISPMVNFFEEKFLSRIKIKGKSLRSAKAKRILSIIITYIVVIGALSILLSIVIPQIVESVKEISVKLPGYIESVIEWAQTTKFTIGSDIYKIDFTLINNYIDDSLPTSLNQFTDFIGGFAPELISFTTNLATGFLNIVFGFIIAVYLLFNKEAYLSSSRKVISALTPSKSIEGLFSTLQESHYIFSNFFVGKLIDSTIIGILCFILMMIFRIPYAVLISVIVGVTNMIPYFGPFIGGFIGILFLLIGTPVKALWFAILVLALQQFDGNILGPKILGDSTGLTPFWVIFAIILFGSMFGVMGMFIGVPCFAVIKNIFDNAIDKRYRQRMATQREQKTEDVNYKL